MVLVCNRPDLAVQLLDGWRLSRRRGESVRILRLREPTRHAPAIDLTADGRYLAACDTVTQLLPLCGLGTRNWRDLRSDAKAFLCVPGAARRLSHDRRRRSGALRRQGQEPKRRVFVFPAHPAESAHRDHDLAGGASISRRRAPKPKRCCSRTISSRAWRPSTTSCFVTTSPILISAFTGDENSRGLRFIVAPFVGGTVFRPLPEQLGGAREHPSAAEDLSASYLRENSVFQNRSRPCLLHQIHRCTAPCVGLIDEAHYALDVRLTALFLDGRQRGDRQALPKDAAGRRQPEFEKAAASRDQICSLQKVLHRQYVDSGKDENVDILGVVEEAGVR